MRIRQKDGLLKAILPRVSAAFVLALLLAPVLAAVFPASASANSGDGRFEYSDAKASHIIEIRNDGTQTYTRSTGGDGLYTGGGADGYNGCSAFIQTSSHKYDGDTNAQWLTSCADKTDNIKKSITVAKQKNYTGDWVDHNHITVDGVTYFDSHTDNNLNFVAVKQNNGCDANVIKGFPQSDGGDISNAPAAKLTINEPFSSTNTKCTSKTVPIYFNNTQNFARYFQWVDAGTIRTTDGRTMTFVQEGGKGPFTDSGDSDCKSTLVPDSGDPGHGTLIIRYDGSNPFDKGWGKVSDADFKEEGGCQVSKPIKGVNIANVDNRSKPAGTGDGSPGGAAGAGDDAQIGCEANVNPLSWVVCPVIAMASAAIEATDNLISEQMVLPADDIFCLNSSGNKDTCDAYYTAWASFRNIALGLVVIAGLIIIIAQAVGMEILDAYTIRKMLPRILVAALAITLSWPLMNFAVTLSNNLGFGVRDLITAPFSGLDNTISFSGDWKAVFAGGGAALIGSVAAVAALGILLSYVLTAGLAVLIAILVLVVRQIVIIAFVIISPIAIIAYVLPNTERIFRIWWESFSKALLMFPLIVAFIATGRVFAAVTLSNSQSFIAQITAFVAYFGPYFAIPLTFRMSGSLMSGIGNAINQRGQPGFARLQKYRGEKAAAKLKKARAGQLFNEDFGRFQWRGREFGIAKAANKLAVNVTDQDELIPWRLGKEREFKRGPLKGKTFGGVWGLRGSSASLQDQLDNRAIDESSKLMQEIASKGPMHYEGWRGVAGDISSFKGSITRQNADGSTYTVPVSQALTEAGFSAATPPSSITDFRRMGHILKQSDSDKERQGGNDILEHAGTLASAKRHPDMEYADTQVAGLIGMASAGRIEHEPGANIANAIKKRTNAGVAQRALKTAQAAASRTERPDMRDGHAFILNARGQWESVFSDANYNSDTAYGNIKSIKGQAWSGAKAEAVEAAHRTIVAMATGQASREGSQLEPEDVQSIHEMVEQGIRNPYNDAGQRAAWRKIAEDAGLPIAEGTYTAEQARELGLERPPEPPAAPEPQQQQQA